MRRILLFFVMLFTLATGALATPPATPTGLAAVTTTANSVTLQWSAVSGIGIKYNIYQDGTLLGESAAVISQISGLVNGSSYGFGIQAKNINDELSGISAYLTVTAGSGGVPPGATSNVYCVNCTSGGTPGSVVVSSSALPTGAATQATLQGVYDRLTSTPQGTVADPLEVDAAVTNFPSIFEVQGDISPGNPDSGKPVKMGGIGRTTLQPAVDDGDRVCAVYDKMGAQKTTPSLRELRVVGTITLTDATLTTLITAGAAGIFRDIRSLIVSNDGTNPVTLTLSDGTVSIKIAIASAGGGAVSSFVANWPATTAATVWSAQLSGSPGGNVYVNALAEETR